MCDSSDEFVLEPQVRSGIVDSTMNNWPPAALVRTVGRSLCIPSHGSCPLLIRHGQHIASVCNLRALDKVEPNSDTLYEPSPVGSKVNLSDTSY